MLYVFTETRSGIKSQFAAADKSVLIVNIATALNDGNSSYQTFQNYQQFTLYLDNLGWYDQNDTLKYHHDPKYPFNMKHSLFAVYFDYAHDELMVLSFDSADKQDKSEYNYWIDLYGSDLKSFKIIDSEKKARQYCRDLYGYHSAFDHAITMIQLDPYPTD